MHEYQVDETMIRNGEDIPSYQRLIMNQLFNTKLFSVQNAFSGNTLIKKRMIMMTKKRSGRIAELKLLLVVPVALLLFFAFSCKEESEVTAQPQTIEEKTVATDNAASSQFSKQAELKNIEEDERPYAVVEDMPTFNGGDVNKFRDWVAHNVNYPSIAKENGIQGKVYIMFIVDKNGDLTDAKIMRGVDPSLDNEALRIVRSSPKWKPGMQKGEAVNVRYAITVNFALQ